MARSGQCSRFGGENDNLRTVKRESVRGNDERRSENCEKEHSLCYFLRGYHLKVLRCFCRFATAAPGVTKKDRAHFFTAKKTPRQLYTSRILEKQHFFFNDPATTEIYTLSLHDALPI